ncbi:MAG: ABC transporter ATP-binding protein [Patescibacteria group bacterium]
MIRAIELTKTFGEGELEVKVLKKITLEIADGEFVAIIGPSGAGKSTLMYQLSLLDEPTSGQIFLDAVDTSTLDVAEKTSVRLRSLGYVFQDYALLPELTAAENVALPILMAGVPFAEAMQKGVTALERIGLADKQQNLPSQLSGGQQQRVSIARAIAHNPHILFADEPTANLDTDNGHVVMEVFRTLHEAGQTIIMVTHEDEYARYADRIITMKDGVIVTDERRKR